MDSVLDHFFEIFPITSKKWETRLRKYLSEENRFKTIDSILEIVRPVINEIIPNPKQVFRAINLVEPDQVKIVILGQDPYPEKRSACGLCFSVEHNCPPASLKNIFKEIQFDFGGEIRKNGNLIDWANQGVLLLNSSLTVLPNQANSHSRIGWQIITEFIIKTVWIESPSSIFLLWGNNAKQLLSPLPISPRILITGHPSPLAYGKRNEGNFKRCGHFKKANEILVSFGHTPIVWY